MGVEMMEEEIYNFIKDRRNVRETDIYLYFSGRITTKGIRKTLYKLIKDDRIMRVPRSRYRIKKLASKYGVERVLELIKEFYKSLGVKRSVLVKCNRIVKTYFPNEEIRGSPRVLASGILYYVLEDSISQTKLSKICQVSAHSIRKQYSQLLKKIKGGKKHARSDSSSKNIPDQEKE